MKTAQRHDEFAVGDKAIGYNAVRELRLMFMSHYGRPPIYLKMSPSARNDLYAQLDAVDMLADETILGLVPDIDPTLQDGEWRVGNSREVISEVKL